MTTKRIEPLLIKPAEAAALLSIGRTSVYWLINTGQLPAVRMGGIVRVPMSAVRKLAGESVGSGGDEAA